MSARYGAWIQIGGQLRRSHAPTFLKAITEADVSPEWGDSSIAPSSADELIDLLKDGRIWLCDVQAHYGEFDQLEATCRRLDLAYTRHTEGSCDCDAELVDWRLGMKEPSVRVGSNVNPAKTFVPVDYVKEALAALASGDIQQTTNKLRGLCPEVPELPPFAIV